MSINLQSSPNFQFPNIKDYIKKKVINILFYDSALPELELLLKDVDPNYILVPLDRSQDFNNFFQNWTTENKIYQIDRLGVLAHGTTGNIHLGSSPINSSYINKNRDFMLLSYIASLLIKACL